MSVWRSVWQRWGARRPLRARGLVRFVEEGQSRASLPPDWKLCDVSVGRPAATPAGGRGTARRQNYRPEMRRPDTRRRRRAHRPWPPSPRRCVLDRYRLERRLGAGGFGVVWRAYDQKLEREVAVKVVPASSDADPRTEREARAAARLNHPGIVALYELAATRSRSTWSRSWWTGATLGELIADGAVSDRDVAKIGLALCDALAHAHARGVIHRDVKPAERDGAWPSRPPARASRSSPTSAWPTWPAATP